MTKSEDQQFSREYFVQQGRRGGKTRAKNLTKEERTAQARKAVTARWSKRKEAKGR